MHHNFELCILLTSSKNQIYEFRIPNIFLCLNENLTTFIYTLTGATRKQKEIKKFSLLKCTQKLNVNKKNWVLVFSFMYLVFS